MKILVVVTIIIVFLFAQSSDASVGDTFDTTTTITIPEPIIAGEATTITSSTLSSIGGPFLGETSFILSDNIIQLGSTQTTNSIIVNEFAIQFTPLTSIINAKVFRIPISDISTHEHIHWKISDDGSQIATGDIDYRSLNSMRNTGWLTLVLDTFQTDGHANPTSLNFDTVSVYEILVYSDDPTTFSFSLPVSNSGDLAIYDENGFTRKYTAVNIYTGSSLGRINVINGVSIIQTTLDAGLHYIFSYYSDSSANFGPSMDMISLDVVSLINPTLVLNDQVGQSGNLIKLNTSIFDINQLPLDNALIKYYISIDNIGFTEIGTMNFNCF